MAVSADETSLRSPDFSPVFLSPLRGGIEMSGESRDVPSAHTTNVSRADSRGGLFIVQSRGLPHGLMEPHRPMVPAMAMAHGGPLARPLARGVGLAQAVGWGPSALAIGLAHLAW